MTSATRTNFVPPQTALRRSTRSRAPRAFTLLELLVALTMAAIIAGSLYAGLRTAFRARTTAEAGIEPVRSAELATSLLRADFESARPTTGTLSGPFVGTDNAGSAGLPADTIDFYTLGNPTDPVTQQAAAAQSGSNAGPASMIGPQAAVPAGEARHVQLALEPFGGPSAATSTGTAEQVLVRYVDTNLLAQVTAQPFREVLCRGVRSMNIQYFDGSTWQDSWDSTQVDNNIPCAVQITLELERVTDGQPTVIQFPRVFLVSCSALSPTNPLGSSAGTGTGTGTGTGGTTP